MKQTLQRTETKEKAIDDMDIDCVDMAFLDGKLNTDVDKGLLKEQTGVKTNEVHKDEGEPRGPLNTGQQRGGRAL